MERNNRKLTVAAAINSYARFEGYFHTLHPGVNTFSIPTFICLFFFRWRWITSQSNSDWKVSNQIKLVMLLASFVSVCPSVCDLPLGVWFLSVNPTVFCISVCLSLSHLLRLFRSVSQLVNMPTRYPHSPPPPTSPASLYAYAFLPISPSTQQPSHGTNKIHLPHDPPVLCSLGKTRGGAYL